MKYKQPEEFFSYLKEEFGLSVFENSERCLAIASDMFEGDKQVNFLIKTAFDNKVYIELLKAKNSTSENKVICIERALKILTDDCSIDLEKATNVVGLLASIVCPEEWNTFKRKIKGTINSQSPILSVIPNRNLNLKAKTGIAFALIIILSLLINNVISQKQIKETLKNDSEIKATKKARTATEKEAKEKDERVKEAKFEADLKAKEETRIVAEKEAKEKDERDKKTRIKPELKTKKEPRIAEEKKSKELVKSSEQKQVEQTNSVSSENLNNSINYEEKMILVEAFKILGYENKNFSVKNIPNKYKDMSESIAWAYNPDDYSKPDRMNFLIQFFINELNYKGTISAQYKEIEPLDRKIPHFKDYVLLSNKDESDIFGFAMSTGIGIGEGETCPKDMSNYFLLQLLNNNFVIIDTKDEDLGNRTKTIYLQRNNDLFRYAVISVSPLESFGNTVFGYYINLALSNRELD